jgi:hypothetical protein
MTDRVWCTARTRLYSIVWKSQMKSAIKTSELAVALSPEGHGCEGEQHGITNYKSRF